MLWGQPLSRPFNLTSHITISYLVRSDNISFKEAAHLNLRSAGRKEQYAMIWSLWEVSYVCQMLLVNALCMGQSIVCLPQIVTWLEGAYLISAASIPSSMMWLAYGTSSSTANGHMFHFYWREHFLLVISPVYRRIYPSVCCSVSFCILIVLSVYTNWETLTGGGMQHAPSWDVMK